MPFGQGEQAAEPAAAAKKPKSQRVQAVKGGALKEPALQGTQAGRPGAEAMKPALQETQVLGSVA